MNIIFSVKNSGAYTLIEAHLTEPLKKGDWVVFLNNIVIIMKNTKRLYMLIDKNKYENDFDYITANSLLQKKSKLH